jgi:sec-independent protein translocase protein TatA
MATIQGIEWIILGVVVIILIFGARKIPELARSFGRATGEFRKGREEIEREIRATQHEETQREKLERAARDLGIDPAGKSDEQLKQEIEKALLR